MTTEKSKPLKSVVTLTFYPRKDTPTVGISNYAYINPSKLSLGLNAAVREFWTQVQAAGVASRKGRNAELAERAKKRKNPLATELERVTTANQELLEENLTLEMTEN